MNHELNTRDQRLRDLSSEIYNLDSGSYNNAHKIAQPFTVTIKKTYSQMKKATINFRINLINEHHKDINWNLYENSGDYIVDQMIKRFHSNE